MSNSHDWNEESATGAASPKATAESTADEPRRRAAGVGERVSDQAEAAAAGARVRAERGREEIAGELGTVVHHLQESASELRQRDAWLASVIGRGAEELDGLARSLKDRDLGDIVTSLDEFARRQPGLFMGAAVGLGFALTRLAKSSADRRPHAAPETVPPTASAGTAQPHAGADSPSRPAYPEGGLT